MKHWLQAFFLLVLSVACFGTEKALAQAEQPGGSVEAPRQESYVLSSAYPNPFSRYTSFNLTVSQRQEVQIQVFNLLGQPVRQIFSGVMNAGETRTFTFDASGLPSGIYIYRVQGQFFKAARQMTLLN
jgi:hypothetical protein